jgi:protein arginine N-methyltransferase 1
MAGRDERRQLGQFIPIQYHFNMLDDERRTGAFEKAIDAVVRPGMRVVELGGGTGVLSFFAARAGAAKVWCVEYDPQLLEVATMLMRRNGVSGTVSVVDADADEYLPPEPVDVVICEMLHVGLLRERQEQVINSFLRRYRDHFGPPAPQFVPDAITQAIQPVQQDFVYRGYEAPTVHFQDGFIDQRRTVELAPPAVYQLERYEDGISPEISWSGTFTATTGGTWNAVRLVTKNALAILAEEGRTIDWLMNYLVIPLELELEVAAGDVLELALDYPLGGGFDEVRLCAHSTRVFL